jgi:hypothetical protein
MASSGMLHSMALVRTDVWEELRASIIRVTRIVELGTTLAITSNRPHSSQMLVSEHPAELHIKILGAELGLQCYRTLKSICL